jgi:hypothetical protein
MPRWQSRFSQQDVPLVVLLFVIHRHELAQVQNTHSQVMSFTGAGSGGACAYASPVYGLTTCMQATATPIEASVRTNTGN